jgi:Holliday junction resolvasome RuvABC endonuclease subunit
LLTENIVKKVLDQVEKMYPTSVTLAFNYFVSTRPNIDVTKRLLRILCDIVVDDDMLSMTFNDACGIENGFDIRYALTSENTQMRREAVLSGLKYFNETIEKTSSSMNNLFFKLLLDRSTDFNLSIAKFVFDEKKLWLTCSLQDTLSQLFYQIYFLLGQSTKGSLPWVVNIPESLVFCKESVTSVLVHLLSQNMEIQERLCMVLDCLSLIIEHYSSKVDLFSR